MHGITIEDAVAVLEMILIGDVDDIRYDAEDWGDVESRALDAEERHKLLLAAFKATLVHIYKKEGTDV